jgi:hypothetical protein
MSGVARTRSAGLYAGLFSISLVGLLYELLLTRIWSVTIGYHFAFLAISVAMFGATFGAVTVFLLPSLSRAAGLPERIAGCGVLLSLAVVFSLLTHMSIPFQPRATVLGIYSAALTFLVLALPFFVAGVCVTLILSGYREHVASLYAADLGGAATACLVFGHLFALGDGPNAVLAVAAIAAFGGALLGRYAGERRIVASGLAIGAVLVVCVALNERSRALRLVWVNEPTDRPVLFERWNSFSRIVVRGDPEAEEPPFGWGMSPTYPAERRVRQLRLMSDTTMATVLPQFSGDLKDVEYLKHDATSLAYRLRPGGSALIAGSGGGRDVLTALLYGFESVAAVEINEDIIDTVNREFGDFTGHLDRDPRVTFVNDDARTFVARSRAAYDVIQLSIINTENATGNGAYALTENSLYTVEAWESFLEHLRPGGLLTCTRFYFQGEIYRTVSLARAALARLGVGDARDHMMLVRVTPRLTGGPGGRGTGTLIVGREPLDERTLREAEAAIRGEQFELALGSSGSADPILERIAAGTHLDGVAREVPFEIDPPTDDWPYFFFMIPLERSFERLTEVTPQPYTRAQTILVVLLFVVTGMSALCIFTPLVVSGQKIARESLPLFGYFGAIGAGFMFVEISQMQRFSILLGHPVYGLSITLFTLLLGSGLGSYLSPYLLRTVDSTRLRRHSIVLLLVLCSAALLSPAVIRACEAAVIAVRAAAAASILFPIGLVLGVQFPSGIRLASPRHSPLIPWFWGINGAMSVWASVFALAASLTFGISATLWIGVVCYAAACLSALLFSARSERASRA